MSERPQSPASVADQATRANRLRIALDSEAYQWVQDGARTSVRDMAPAQLAAALRQSIDMLEALGRAGFSWKADFEAWKDNSGYYVWMERGAMHDLDDLSGSDLGQALCRLMDLVEGLDLKLLELQHMVESWRKGEKHPQAASRTRLSATFGTS